MEKGGVEDSRILDLEDSAGDGHIVSLHWLASDGKRDNKERTFTFTFHRKS